MQAASHDGQGMVDSGGGARPRVVWSVAALLRAVADALAGRFSSCTVSGELSGFSRAASGHCYFSLKDPEGAGALVRCAMFRRAASLLDFSPADGQAVELRGRLSVYEPRGELQLVVESMQRAGAGTLFEQFLRLKARLEAQGLFAPERKRLISRYPRRIGLVTSLAAAALHDIVTALARRAPQVELIVYPSLVQGPDAPQALSDAITLASLRREVDTLLVCRGGGSLEDLWAFNDERVVRAIAACSLPVVCGVGHETDVTLADFAADLRAPTPTAAAELAAPSQRECEEALAGVARVLQRRVRSLLDTHTQRLDRATLRLARPGDALARETQRLGLLAHRLSAAASRSCDMRGRTLTRAGERLIRAGQADQQARTQRLDRLAARLSALDPRLVLSRGYAWLSDADGNAVISVKSLSAGQALSAVLADGQADLRVLAVRSPPRS